MLHHETKIPDEAYVKIKSVHNNIVGRGGVETTISKLAKGRTRWTYMRIHVRKFIQLCPSFQKMGDSKFADMGNDNYDVSVFIKPFSVATYSPMVRLNIDFVGPINADDGSGYILVIIDSFPSELNSSLVRMPQQRLLRSTVSNTVRQWQSHRERTHY